MEMKKCWAVIAVMAIFLTWGGFSPVPAQDKPIVLKYAELAPKMVRTEAGMWWIDEVQKRTGGRVKIEYYAAESLVKANDMPDAVRTKVCDIATFVTVYYPTKVPLWTIVDVGGVSSAYAVMMATLDLYKSDPAFQKILDNWNCRLLFPQTSAGETILVFRGNLNNLNDIKGKKIRAVGDQAILIKGLGGVPLPVTQPEIFTALQTGTLDGALGFPSQAMSFAYFEVTKTWLRGAPGQYMVPAMINKDSWNSLPKDIQKIMDDVTVEQVKYLANLMKTKEGEIIEKVQKEKGIKVVNLTAEEVKTWRAQYAPIWEKWKKDASQKGADGEKLLSTYFDLCKKYGG
jgi:TRAP-type transport system periplasmic protein